MTKSTSDKKRGRRKKRNKPIENQVRTTEDPPKQNEEIDKKEKTTNKNPHQHGETQNNQHQLEENGDRPPMMDLDFLWERMENEPKLHDPQQVERLSQTNNDEIYNEQEGSNVDAGVIGIRQDYHAPAVEISNVAQLLVMSGFLIALS